jgi:hypothetical protein
MNEEQIVEKFGKVMVDKLMIRRDRYLPLAWRTLDLKRLVMLMREEFKELEHGFENGNDAEVNSAAIDLANYGCFIWDLLHIHDEK